MRRLSLLVLPLLLAPALAACGSDDPAASDGDGLTIVASFYPAAFVATRVAGDHAQVTQLTLPGAEPHDLELTAKQVASIHDADLVVYLSAFQSSVDAAIDEAAPAHVVDLAHDVELIAASEDEHDHEHGDEHGHDDHDHDHDHGDVDPHVWLDPANLVEAARSMATELGELDAAHAEEYRSNAESLVADLEQLDSDFTTGLQRCERSEFVTSHAAFGYLAHAYDLTQIPIAGIEPSSEPSTATLAAITDLVTDHGVTTIFTERIASPALAETVARETGATIDVLDPIEGLTDETADEDYLSLMRANLAALERANGCQ